MTQDEIDKEVAEGRLLVSKILNLFDGMRTDTMINTLLSCVINAAEDSGISKDSIVLALIMGLNMNVFAVIPENLDEKETKH